MQSDTLDIYGCSDRINQIAGDIQRQQAESDSLGINRFFLYYPNVDYIYWMDSGLYKNCLKDNLKNQKLITCNKIAQKEVRGRHKLHYVFEPGIDLMGGGTSATYAIDFARKNNYRKVRLYGVLDGTYEELDEKNLTYKYFWGEEKIIEKKRLEKWKKTILSFRDVIDIEIPYLNF